MKLGRMVVALALAACNHHDDEQAKVERAIERAGGIESAPNGRPVRTQPPAPRKPRPRPLGLDEAKAQCANKVADACGQLAFMYARGIFVNTDTKKAVELATPGCDAGDPASCFALGVATELDAKLGGTPKGLELYAKACALGHPDGCTEAGMVYFSGRGGTSPDPAQAASMLGKGCELGDSIACMQQGIVERCIQNPASDPACRAMAAPKL